MDKKIKVILALVVVIVVAVAGALYFVGNADVTLEGINAQVTAPNTFELNKDGVASNGTVDLMFTGIMEDIKDEDDFQKAIKTNGNSSGYKNYTENTINGFRVYEFAGSPNDLKILKYGSSTQWTEYPVDSVLTGAGVVKTANHFRVVNYISPNNATVNRLTISTTDPSVDLYSSDINKIVESIEVVNK